MKRNTRPPALGLVALALFPMVSPLEATTYLPAGIETDTILVHDGKVIFVQPGGGLTVLDAETGAVRLRLPPPGRSHGSYQLLRTAAGILVWAGGKFRMVDVGRLEITWSLSGCDLGYFLAPEGLVCISDKVSPPERRTRFALHRLADGKRLWTYRSRHVLWWSEEFDISGFQGQLLDGRGRLLLTFEDWSERERVPVRGGFLEQSVRRVVGLAVLDLVTGKELLPGLAQDVKLEGRVGEPLEFDGERISYALRREPRDNCEGVRRRTLTLNAGATGVASEDRCGPAAVTPKAAAEGNRSPTAGRCFDSTPLGQPATRALPSGSVTLSLGVEATLVDVTTGDRRWRAAIPTDLNLTPDVGNTREDGGLIFLESRSVIDDVGRLDALDAKAHRPRWTYVYPSTQQLGSWSGVLPLPRMNGPSYSGPWAAIQSQPPRGMFRLGQATRPPLEAHPGRFEEGAVPVVLDPGPVGRAPGASPP